LTDASRKPVVWITGAGGLIGNYLLQSTARFAPHWQARGLTRDQLDLTNFHSVREMFHRESPAAIIHCAAMSKSPECQANPQLARTINVDVTAVLAELAAEIPFVFFSSDLVFDGKKGHYEEADAVNPLSVYAETKVAAERLVLTNPRHTVIRTSLNAGTSPRGDSAFNEQLRLEWQAGRVPKLFVDEFRCPLPALATARATWELLDRGAVGLFHVAGAERLSRLQIGEALAARHPELKPKLLAGSLQEYSGAPRAPDTSLRPDKAQALLSFPLPGFRSWLAAHPDEAL